VGDQYDHGDVWWCNGPAILLSTVFANFKYILTREVGHLFLGRSDLARPGIPRIVGSLAGPDRHWHQRILDRHNPLASQSWQLRICPEISSQYQHAASASESLCAQEFTRLPVVLVGGQIGALFLSVKASTMRPGKTVGINSPLLKVERELSRTVPKPTFGKQKKARLLLLGRMETGHILVR